MEENFNSRDFVDILKMFSPGTSLRSALDDLLRARMGALIVFDNSELASLMEGGFHIKSKFSSQKLVELAKMDGAIILSKDGKKILHANVMLHPDLTIFSRETGTRHKSAERTAKQIKTVVVAVSERKNKIGIYYCNEKYELESSAILLSRTSEVLQILEKQREILNELTRKFNILEVNNLVTINDVCSVLRRIEILKRVSDFIKRYLIELGKEGVIISMRLKELVGDIPKLEEYILEDYFGADAFKILNILDSFVFDALIDSSVIYEFLSNEVKDKFVSPRGIRLLKKMGLEENDLGLLISKFDCLKKILDAEDEDLLIIFGSPEEVDYFKNSLNELKQNILLNKDF
jgi:diadenylate cyclase